MTKGDLHLKLINIETTVTLTDDDFTSAYGNIKKHHQTDEDIAVILARTYNLNVEYDDFLKSHTFTKEQKNETRNILPQEKETGINQKTTNGPSNKSRWPSIG